MQGPVHYFQLKKMAQNLHLSMCIKIIKKKKKEPSSYCTSMEKQEQGLKNDDRGFGGYMSRSTSAPCLGHSGEGVNQEKVRVP